MSEHAEDIDLSTQREDQRISIYVVARLQAEAGEHACEVLNLSAGGAMVKVVADLRSPEPIILDIPAVGQFGGRVAWQHNQFIGVAFDEKLDNLEGIVQAITAASQQAEEKRIHKRTSVLWRGRLYAAGKTHEMRVLNISPTGAKLRGPKLPEETAIMVIVDRVGEVPARVVWSDREQLGVRFLDHPDVICDLFGELLPAMKAQRRGDAASKPE